MKLTVLLSLCTGEIIQRDTIDFLTSSLEGVLSTQPETPEEINLKVEGTIPEWIDGSFYRNGPGKFEFGEDSFSHMFDPMALVQRTRIKSSEVTYSSKYIRSRNFKANQELNKIVFPELGTAAEPDWVHLDENGNELTEEEIILNRRKFFLEPESKTDNTLVSLHPLCGHLVAFSETMNLNSLDLDTLETTKSFSLEQAKNYPGHFIGMTQTPHGFFTSNGDFVNLMTGLLFEEEVFRPPKVAYFVYRIKGAKTRICSVEEMLEEMEFSEPAFNLKPHSLKVGYMHEGVMAGDYFFAILSSTVTDLSLVSENVKKGRPLLESNQHDPDREQEIRVFNTKTFQWEAQVPTLPTGIMLHTINGKVVEESRNEVKFEFAGLWSGNPEVLSMFYLDALRSEDDEFEELRSKVTPSGTPTQIKFSIRRDGRRGLKPSMMRLIPDEEDWSAYTDGGVEFPVINPETAGHGSEHFWAVGYAQVLGDRLYHTNGVTGERQIYMVPGFQPSEPGFIPRPGATQEDDGVIVAAMAPIVGDKTGFVAFLDASNMTELARAYFPSDLNLATGFHSLWMNS